VPALLLVAAMSAAAACSGGGGGAPVAPTTPATPHRTIRQVLPSIEAFVEKERGLKFKHRVKATILGRKAFVKRLDKTNGKPKAKEVEKLQGLLTSLGLVSPGVDLAKAFKTANDQGTIGFYDFKTKKLYVRGTSASPGVRAVLSHELTHALTDQWFGLRRPKLDKDNNELGLGFTALVEGDAERIRTAYEKDVLTAAERQSVTKEENSGGVPSVPKIVLELIRFPYAIGPTFVNAVLNQGGTAALNAAYRNPPTTSEQLILPAEYFEHHGRMPVPVPAADGPRLTHGDLGFFGFLLMLEHGLPRADAQLGAYGWGGDQFVLWRAGHRRWCMRDSVVMDTPVATSNFDAALQRWVATRNGKAVVEHTGTTTTFRTCSS
jgi:hypothetical protein